MGKVSEARLRANKKYNDKTYNRTTVRFKHEEFEALQRFCERTGSSANGVIRRAVMQYVNFLNEDDDNE